MAIKKRKEKLPYSAYEQKCYRYENSVELGEDVDCAFGKIDAERENVAMDKWNQVLSEMIFLF